ncbi:MAG: hypothetical protein RSA29_02770 [Clostridium sp.]|uniref:hypothetical protein n=1 Tax=Clostridium sp. TaxID=1506 RepID=UPI003040EFD8
MKLTLNQIQALDLYLKRLISRFPIVSQNENLNIVISINNSLWTGDFIQYEHPLIINRYIDCDSSIESNGLYPSDIFTLPDNFKFVDYRNIKSDTAYLLLLDLFKVVVDIPAPTITLNPLLYNAKNLETNLSLPFIHLDSTIEYEVISLTNTFKDECTHS